MNSYLHLFSLLASLPGLSTLPKREVRASPLRCFLVFRFPTVAGFLVRVAPGCILTGLVMR